MRCVYVYVCECEEMVGGAVVGEESGRVVGGESGSVGEGRVRGTVVEGVSNRGQYMHKRVCTYTHNRHTHTHTRHMHSHTQTDTCTYTHTNHTHTIHAYTNRTPTYAHTQKQKQSFLLPHKVTLPSKARMPVH